MKFTFTLQTFLYLMCVKYVQKIKKLKKLCNYILNDLLYPKLITTYIFH
jgi:hypothetical protein